MYSACLFCHADLGHNPVLAGLAIGRRVAFDPAKGRLWVVCLTCGRWNLTPFEDRWETLEDCERLFRNTRLRYSTDNIGLAQPRWGFELVRIGAALREEIAAWRYGTKLLSRAPTIAGYAQNLGMSSPAVMRLRTMPRRHTALTCVWLGHDRVPLRYAHLPHAELLRPDHDEVWRMRVRHDHGESLLEGAEALQVARTLLTALNDGTAPEDMVNSALEKLDDAGHADGYFARVGALARSTSWGRVTGPAIRDDDLDRSSPRLAERVIVRLTTRSFWARGGTGSEDSALLHRISEVDRLALEMAANEDAERIALEGELDQLRDAWREAEEVAAIADRLPA
ncbi:MAG: hypothetical protein AABZ80_07370 [Gemmatimonadota bacterium]